MNVVRARARPARTWAERGTVPTRRLRSPVRDERDGRGSRALHAWESASNERVLYDNPRGNFVFELPVDRLVADDLTLLTLAPSQIRSLRSQQFLLRLARQTPTPPQSETDRF